MTTRTVHTRDDEAIPLLADRFTLGERATIPVAPPRRRRSRTTLQPAHPIAAHVLGQLTTRFRAAAEQALEAETARGQAAAYLESLRLWLLVGGPCPRALRDALEVVQQSNPAVQTEVTT
jgi:hypothetical protein